MPGTLNLRARRRSNKVSEGTLRWDVAQTAIIICDMWDAHTCSLSAQRVAAMAPRMNQVISTARSLVVMIVHAPSDTMKFYDVSATQSTYERMKKAAETPGAIAGNELVQTEKQMDAAKALLNSRQQAIRAAESAVRALIDLQAYLKITAPFDGVVTERQVHPGALVGPGNGVPLLVVQQVSHLRVVVPVPEEDLLVDGTDNSTLLPLSHTRQWRTKRCSVEIAKWSCKC